MQIGRERRLYRRYLGEARAQRAKALRAWCAFNRDENQNSRNELKLQLIRSRDRLAPAKAPVQQPASNAKYDAHDIRDPVVKVGAAVEAGLDEFNGAPEGTRADEDGEQSDAARARQREGECGEGHEVHELVASLRRRRAAPPGARASRRSG